MKNIINKQLKIFYKSTTIFKYLSEGLLKNKYFFPSIVVLALITFLFNKNLDSFNNLNVNVQSIVFSLISLYLIYIKFNLLTRIISLVKGVTFFYKEIKLNLIQDIKIITLYFYSINLFFISISLLFIWNLINNIFTINSDLGIYIDSSTNFISLIILLFYFNKIFNKKFFINSDEINPLKVFFLIIIVLTPFIVLNFYGDQIMSLFNLCADQIKKYLSIGGEMNIFKLSTVHCQSTDDSNYNDRLKEKSNITNNNNNSNVNTSPTEKPISNLNEGECSYSTSPSPTETNMGGANINEQNIPSSDLLYIQKFNQLPPKLFYEIFTGIQEPNLSVSDKVENFNKLKNPITHESNRYKLSPEILNFLDKYKDSIILKEKDNHDRSINFLNKLLEKEINFNNNLNVNTMDHQHDLLLLDKMEEINYKNFQKDFNRYMNANHHYLNKKEAYVLEHNKDMDNLKSEFKEEVEHEINEFQSKKYKYITKLKKLVTKKRKSNLAPNNSPSTSENINPPHLSNDGPAEQSGQDSGGRSTPDSDRTIKQKDFS